MLPPASCSVRPPLLKPRREAGPEVNVDQAKRETLRAIVAHLSRHNGWTPRQVRVDVVAVQILEEGAEVVRRFEDVLNG